MPHSSEVEEKDPAVVFAEQRSLLEGLYRQPLDAQSEIFEHGQTTCGCIDEGTPAEFRLAGAGIIDPKGFGHVVELMRQARVTKVISHAGCAAVEQAAAKELGLNATPEQIEDFGKAWAEKVAAALGVPAEHQTELERPGENHDASVIYVDAVGGFRPDRRLGELPKGFVISAHPTGPEQTAAQVRLAVGVMFGDHGVYRDQFSAESPLHIIVLGATATAEGHDLIEAIHHAVADLGPKVYLEQLLVAQPTK